MFGQQQNNLFGNKPAQPTAFGSSATTSGFGVQPTQNAFGVQQPQQQTSLFGNPTQPNAFGTMSQAGAGTPSLFGGTTGQTSIFGNTGTAQTGMSSAFGATNAASTFGRPAGSTMFGGTTATNAFGSGGFGATGSTFGVAAAPVGTTIKFTPVAGTDTMLKNGVNANIQTRHQCITAMKEYEAKSLEELRFEDYAAGRKGPQATTGFGAAQPTGHGMFGTPQAATATPNTGFGSNIFSQQKPAFGSTMTPTPTSTTSLFNTPFSKPTGFGTTGSGIFGAGTPQAAVQPTQQTSLFNTGQQQQPPAFGQQTTGFAGFGATAQNAVTGNKSLFGPTSQPQSTLGFGTGLNTAFNTGTAASKTMFGPTGGTNTGFGTPAIGTTTPAFPTFSSAAATTTTQSLFGPQSTGLFSNPAQKSFSFNTTQPAFGSTLGQQNTILNPGTGSFFNTGSAFGNTGSTGLFGQSLGTSGSSLFPTIQSSQLTLPGYPGFNQNKLQSPPDNSNTELFLSRLQTLPYGSSSLFQNDLSALNSSSTTTKFTTDAKQLNQYKVSNTQQVAKRTPAGPSMPPLFDDLDDDNHSDRMTAAELFSPRKNIKKLIIKPKLNVPSVEFFTTSAGGTSSNSPNEQFHEASSKSPQNQPAEDDNNTIYEFVRHKPPVKSPEDSMRKALDFSLDSSEVTVADDSSTSPLNKSSVAVLKCGLFQSRCDYYTIPPLDAIDACFNEEDGTCILSNLTIGRKKYGSIYWEGPLDVSGLNLDEIVHIRRKEVIVYPDDEQKPPVGQGLNRPAQITLDQVWPIDKITHELIKDPERLEEMNYSEKIEAATVKLKATFRDYRPESGSWVFCVKHFSKYGILDDDEEDDDHQTGSSKPMAVGGPSPPRVVPSDQTRSVKDLQIPMTGSGHISSSSSSSLHPSLSHQTYPMVLHQNIPEKTVVHKISSFSTPFEQKFLDFPKPEDFVYKTSFMPQTDKNRLFEETFKNPASGFDYYGGLRNVLFDDNEILDDDLMDPDSDHHLLVKPIETKRKKQRLLSIDGERDRLASSTPTRVGLTPTTNVPVVTAHEKRQLKFMVSQYPARNKVILDIASVTVTPVSRVRFFCGSSKFLTISGRNVIVSKLSLIPDLNDDEEQRLEAQLSNQSSIVKDVSNTAPFADVIRKSCNALNPAELNQLVIALYSDLKTETEYEWRHERMNLVIDWLSEHNSRKFKKHPSDAIMRIFHHLCINDLKGAVDEAIRSKQPRLALLLSTATCPASKELILFQLDSWKTSGADVFIGKNLLKLYVLMSGIIDWTLSSDEKIFAMEGLNWSQQLILMLLYNQDADLKECVEKLPTECSDVEYHLLANHNGNQWIPLDYCSSILESWFLHNSLIAFNAIQHDTNKSDVLHGMFVSQLLDANHILWAAFAAIHILDDDLRTYLLQEVLSRGASTIGSDEKKWLTEKLAIPDLTSPSEHHTPS